MKQLKFVFWLFLLLGISYFTLNAQQGFVVEGTVTEAGSTTSLPGVNDLEKGTVNGVITNLEGKYRISVNDPNATLVFSYVGFLSEEIAVNNQHTINMSMATDIQEMDAVVVIGYGTARKSDLTGALSSVSGDDLKKIPSMNLDDALKGQAAGVHVVSNTGAPGSSMSVRIRGLSTLNAGKEPLYVVDGIIMGDPSIGKDGATTTDNKTGIGFLDPSDIESIEVLKDASAAAIYGARGTNGVVLITTKKGKAGKAKIEFDMYRGVQSLPNSYDLMNAEQFREYSNEFRVNQGRPPYSGFADSLEVNTVTNWVNEVTNPNAIIEKYKFSASGGKEEATYYFSTSYFNQDGIIKGSGYNKFNIRLNSAQKLTNRIKTGQNIIVSRSFRNRLIEGSNNTVFANALKADPSAMVYDTSSVQLVDPTKPNWTYLERTRVSNPVGILERESYTYESMHYFGTGYMQIEILPTLVFKSIIGIDINNGDMEYWQPRYFVSPEQSQDENNFEKRKEQWINWDFENTLTYSKDIGLHSFSIMIGGTAQQEKFEDLRLDFNRFPYDQEFMRYPNVNNVPKEVSSVQSSPMGYSILSGLSRVSYNYAGKYLFTATYRTDGSSKFGSDNRWAGFPSFSLAYKISEETFFKNIPYVSFLKVRGGWGQLGNQSIPPYSYSTTIFIDGNNYLFGSPEKVFKGYLPNGSSNSSIRWESTTQTNVGVDLGLFNNQLVFNVDAFYKITDDLLMKVPTPFYSGEHNLTFPGTGNRPLAYGNVAEMENKGIESNLTYKLNVGDFSINTSANISFVRNKVLDLSKGEYIYSNAAVFGNQLSQTEVGGAVARFYGYVVEGIFKDYDEIASHADQGVTDPYTFNRDLEPKPRSYTAPGDFKFKDVNGDGVINEQDRTYIGNPLPDFTYGFSINASYKSFDFYTNFFGVYGNDVINVMKFYLMGSSEHVNKIVDAQDHWNTENPNSTNPRIGTNRNDNMRFSDYFVEDASFLRWKTLTVGYSLPERYTNAINVNNLRIHFTLQNLYTFTNYSGIEPEVGNSVGWSASPLDFGVDQNTYPHARVSMLGINVTF